MLENLTNWIGALDTAQRVGMIFVLAAVAHLLVRLIRRMGEWMVAPTGEAGQRALALARQRPKFATVTGLASSALTFLIYFVAIGLILDAFHIDLTVYLATASVIGLAVGFGSQGMVQDVVIGLTVIFSDAFDVGDVIEVSGQIGRVERIGLRFTTLVNFLGQTVYVPNRNIGQVGRFRRGAIRAYVDVQMPAGAEEAEVLELVDRIARGVRAQHPAVLVTDPETFGVYDAEPGDWRFMRVKFRLWPGQGALIDTVFRQRILAALKRLDANYADWMVTVTYRVA